MASIPLFLHILPIFLPSTKFSLFSAIFVGFLPYLPIFLPFLSVFESSFSLAEQNCRIWPPLSGYFFGRTGLSFGRKKWLAPPKKCPRNAYVHSIFYYNFLNHFSTNETPIEWTMAFFIMDSDRMFVFRAGSKPMNNDL